MFIPKSLISVLSKLQSAKLRQIGFFARGKRLQSSPILSSNQTPNFQNFGAFELQNNQTDEKLAQFYALGHPPKSFLTCGRWFQSSPIWWVNRLPAVLATLIRAWCEQKREVVNLLIILLPFKSLFTWESGGLLFHGFVVFYLAVNSVCAITKLCLIFCLCLLVFPKAPNLAP